MTTLLTIKLATQVYKKQTGLSDILPPMLGLFVIIFAMVYQDIRGFLYYPVIVNLTLLVTFSLSLFYGQPVITRLAQITTPLDDEGKKYTRQLTKVWVTFFSFNALIALITTQLSLDVWTLYNGGISYILIGLLAGGEWIYRKRILAQ